MYINRSGMSGSGSGNNLWGTGAGEGVDNEFPSLRQGLGYTPTNQYPSSSGSNGSGASSQNYSQYQNQGSRQSGSQRSQDHYMINSDYTYTPTNRSSSHEVI